MTCFAPECVLTFWRTWNSWQFENMNAGMFDGGFVLRHSPGMSGDFHIRFQRKPVTILISEARWLPCPACARSQNATRSAASHPDHSCRADLYIGSGNPTQKVRTDQSDYLPERRQSWGVYCSLLVAGLVRFAPCPTLQPRSTRFKAVYWRSFFSMLLEPWIWGPG